MFDLKKIPGIAEGNMAAVARLEAAGSGRSAPSAGSLKSDPNAREESAKPAADPPPTHTCAISFDIDTTLSVAADVTLSLGRPAL